MNCIVYFNGVVDSVSFTQCLAKRFKGTIDVENVNFISSNYSFYSCTCQYNNNIVQFMFGDISDFDSDNIIKRCNDEYNLQISYNKSYRGKLALVELMDDTDDYKTPIETKNNRNDIVLNMLIRILNMNQLFDSNTITRVNY